MTTLLISLFIFAAPPASAQEAVRPPAAQDTASRMPPRQQNKYYPEILQTMKNLSVLLERWAEVPEEKMDALAPDLAAFDGKVRAALGQQLLSDVARKEKELEDRARAESAKKTLQALRSALQVYYGSNGGVYPKNPSLLIPSVMQEVPELYLPGHDRTIKITVIDSKKYDNSLSRAITDSGGWLYFSNPDSALYGLLVLDCSHTETGGSEFFQY